MAAHMAATLAMLALIAVSSALQVDNLPSSELGPFVIAGSALYKLYKTRPTGSSPSKVLKLESEQRVLREYSTFACNTWLPAIQRKIPLPADRNTAKQLDLDLAQVRRGACHPCSQLRVLATASHLMAQLHTRSIHLL